MVTYENKDDNLLARSTSERVMSICINVMSLINKSMKDSSYGLISESYTGTLLRLTSLHTSDFHAISSCTTSENCITVYTETQNASCTLICLFSSKQGQPYVFSETFAICKNKKFNLKKFLSS